MMTGTAGETETTAGSACSRDNLIPGTAVACMSATAATQSTLLRWRLAGEAAVDAAAEEGGEALLEAARIH